MVSSDGAAGWPDCKVRAGLQHADPLRPTHTAYLRLPAQLLAYALGELGVQAAPQQQRQGAQQEADTRGHVAAAPAAGRGARDAGQPAVGPPCPGPRGCSSSAPAQRRGEGSRGPPVPGLRAPGSSSAALRREPGRGRPARQCLPAGPPAQGPRGEGGRGKREEEAGPRHSGPTHTPRLLEQAAVLEPLPQAVWPRPAPAVLRTRPPVRHLQSIRISLETTGEETSSPGGCGYLRLR